MSTYGMPTPFPASCFCRKWRGYSFQFALLDIRVTRHLFAIYWSFPSEIKYHFGATVDVYNTEAEFRALG